MPWRSLIPNRGQQREQRSPTADYADDANNKKRPFATAGLTEGLVPGAQAPRLLDIAPRDDRLFLLLR